MEICGSINLQCTQQVSPPPIAKVLDSMVLLVVLLYVAGVDGSGMSSRCISGRISGSSSSIVAVAAVEYWK